MCDIITVNLKVRRFDLSDEPQLENKQLKFNPKLDYNSLKNELRNLFGITENSERVVKLRNKDLMLIPLMSLLEDNAQNDFIVDVCKIQQASKSNVNLQDAYLDAVRQKLYNIENRIAQVELMMPQVQQTRQTHMEQTVQNMSTRVAFLSRRIDELIPSQWKSKMPVTT